MIFLKLFCFSNSARLKSSVHFWNFFADRTKNFSQERKKSSRGRQNWFCQESSCDQKAMANNSARKLIHWIISLHQYNYFIKKVNKQETLHTVTIAILLFVSFILKIHLSKTSMMELFFAKVVFNNIHEKFYHRFSLEL